MFSLDRSPSERLNETFYSKVLTPDRIPEFFIPPRLASHRAVVPDAGGSAPGVGRSPPGGRSGPGLTVQVENVDSGCGYSDEESTDADPLSRAALSLTHLRKAQTSYGFCALLESPHTRRKESLFHGHPVNPSASPVLWRGRANTYSTGVATAAPLRANSWAVRVSSPEIRARFGSGHPGLQRKSASDSDTASSTESSPFGSPRLTRSPPGSSLFKALGQERLFGRTFRNGGRAAPVGSDSPPPTDEGSSADTSPDITRRRASEEVSGFPSGPAPNLLLAPPSAFHLDLGCCRETRATENSVPLGQSGVLRLSAEYCRENRRVQVRLISVEGLYAASIEPQHIHCCVTLCLSPGKVQKQRSAAVRKSRNPIFNEDFFFDGVSGDQLFDRFLKVKAINKMSSVKRDHVLGVCELRLGTLLAL
ncbi:C2 calcium-dependent domain-containing protein 4A [Callorhinchus milii]|uniref:C2 calcium-dependent domain-containing protein 4A n=1 Tax=Callorhinchus milii TaxID=7868 RepID=UPI0004574625|nr:C2 calcium-dependent domain-containing protein 4A [Callorhinchus milii]|eukprot:gi/632938638/ref/XP_007905803.1/ PREDICTED: C2 calcium-dependent domain-containing protein 4C-like isoform X2 [Callorhinchus milii]